MEALGRLAAATVREEGDVLLAAGDPANLYGSGAPLDIPLLEGARPGSAGFPAITSFCGGPAVLAIEAGGRRLTAPPRPPTPRSLSTLGRVFELARSRRPGAPRRDLQRRRTRPGRPSSRDARGSASSRDHPGMTYYSAWNPPPPARPFPFRWR
ncbi:MAG: hypothetical protein U0790_24160 [Isosphaeraceae bacterium]